MLNSVRRILENRANARAQRIREARHLKTQPLVSACREVLRSVAVPFEELPEPCYMHTTDADLETFLRRNQLTDALREYLLSQSQRNLSAN